jgi:S1-C subfamily serine protease
MILVAGCSTYGEADLKSFNKDFGQHLPASPEYTIAHLDESHFSITVHQGSPLISSGERRAFYLREAAATIAQAEGKKLGWQRWRIDYIQDGDQGWVHIMADVYRQDFAEITPSQPQGSQEKSSSEPRFIGSGFFITDDGYLISNYHVVKDAAKVRLVTSAGTIDAKVVQVDEANDLALLKADGRFAPLPILPSRSAHLGGTVATVGFPDPSLQGFSPKLAKGEIASLDGAGDDPRYFQISVPVQPGNSGGALVDEHGNVIGIVSAKLDASAALAASGALPENVNYAVKSSLLLSFLESAPDVSAKLKEPVTVDRKFEDVVKSAQDAAVLVLVY